MEIPPEVRYVVREGGSIAYQRFGSGDRRLVSFGNIGNLDLQWSDPSFYEVALQSIDRGEMLIFDQLGFGLSDPVDHVPTFEERAADLGAVMDAAGFERATICGVIESCLTSMVFAAQHPARVDGLVLLSPYAQGWRSAPFEELVGWDSPEQVEAYDRAWRDVLANGIALQSHGERELKGIPGSWELFAVGSETAPLPAPDQTRELRASDRVVLFTARRAPGLLRAASRLGTRSERR